ncbi:DUF4167 domain-containing protein [Mesorhizobium waimense]|nr:DUF4167 domain-containing protein [Mesorhizobium waimense]
MRGRNNNGGGGGNNNNNNNNRKGPNPLTRNYESNGPDVKIRGSAQQIAEKYATLARDAQSSGDRVMAENYLQHAEHYNRIIAAAQAQMPIQNVQQNRDDFDDDGDEDRDEFDNAGNGGNNVGDNQTVSHGGGPQPVIEGTPAEVAFNQESGRDNRNNRDNSGRDNGGRDNGGRHRDRRPSGGYGQNGQRGEQGGQRFDQNRSSETPVQAEAVSQTETGFAPQAETGFAPQAETSFVPQAEPTFTAPADPAFSAETAPLFDSFSPAGLAAQAERNEAAADSGARRPRRPRRPRTTADQADNQADGGSDNAGGNEVSAAPAEGNANDPVIVDVDN